MNGENGAADNAQQSVSTDFNVDPSVFDMADSNESDSNVTDGGNVEAPAQNTDKGQAVTGDEQALSTSPVSPESMVEITKGVSLKIGDKLTADHINQLKRGAYREADYTRKTQELSQARQQATEVLQARDAVLSDPKSLRQFLQDEHILQAFTPDELLIHGLQAAGVPPDAWNRFLEENQGNFNGQAQPNNWQANPLAKDIHSTRAEIQRLQARLQNFETGQKRSAQERAHIEARTQLQNEVKEAAKKYSDVTEEEILEAIAAGRPGNAMQIAEAITARYNARISQRDKALLEQKKRQQQTAPDGTSVPVLPKRPKTWEEAGAATAAYLNGA